MYSIYFRYFLGVLMSIPLLPIMYFQGKRIRAAVPSLPEAKGPAGIAGNNSASKIMKMVVIGESTIAGVGVQTHEEGFSGTLARELSMLWAREVEWEVCAKSGYTAKMVREKLLPKIQEKEPDLIVIGLGGNDSFTLNTPWGWQKDTDRLIIETRHKFPNAWIFFGSMPPIKEFAAFTSLMKWVIGNLAELLGETLREVVRSHDKVAYYHQVVTLDKWIRQFDMKANHQDFFSDGVHPSKLTYQVMAKDMALYIQKCLT